MINNELSGGEAVMMVASLREKVADLEGLVFAETNAKQAALEHVAALEAELAEMRKRVCVPIELLHTVEKSWRVPDRASEYVEVKIREGLRQLREIIATSSARADQSATTEESSTVGKLWAVHAQGPDELYPAFNREDAERHAAALNALSEGCSIKVSAVVVESPWPAAEHWKYLAEQEREYSEQIAAPASGLSRIIIEALEFYASGSHFMPSDKDEWGTVSGEPQNWLYGENADAGVEDGQVAMAALAAYKRNAAPAPVERVEQEAVRKRFDQIEREVCEGKHTAASVFTQMRTVALYTTPQPAPTAAQLDAQDLAEVAVIEAIARIKAAARSMPASFAGGYESTTSILDMFVSEIRNGEWAQLGGDTVVNQQFTTAAQDVAGPTMLELLEKIDAVRMGDEESAHHVHGAAYWNNAVVACLDAVRKAHQSGGAK